MKTNKRKFGFLKSIMICLAFFSCLLTGGMLAVIEQNVKARNSDASGTGSSAQGSPATILLSLVKTGTGRLADKNGNALYYNAAYGVVYCNKATKDIEGAKFYNNFIDGVYDGEISVSANNLTLLEGSENYDLVSQINNGNTMMISDVQRDGSLNNNVVYKTTNTLAYSNITLSSGSKVFSDGVNYFFYMRTDGAVNPTYIMPIYTPNTNTISYFETYSMFSDPIVSNNNDADNVEVSDVQKIYLNVEYNTTTNPSVALSSSVQVKGAQVGENIYVTDANGQNQLVAGEIYIYNVNTRVFRSETPLIGYSDNGNIYRVTKPEQANITNETPHWYFDGTSAKEIENGPLYLARHSTSSNYIELYKPNNNSAPYFCWISGENKAQQLTVSPTYYWYVGTTWIELEHSAGNNYTYDDGSGERTFVINPDAESNKYFIDDNNSGTFDEDEQIIPASNISHYHYTNIESQTVRIPQEDIYKGVYCSTSDGTGTWYPQINNLYKEYDYKFNSTIHDIKTNYIDNDHFTKLENAQNKFFIDVDSAGDFDEGTDTLLTLSSVNNENNIKYENETYSWYDGYAWQTLTADANVATNHKYTFSTTSFYINPNVTLYFSGLNDTLNNFHTYAYYTKDGTNIGVVSKFASANGLINNQSYKTNYIYYNTVGTNDLVYSSNITERFDYYYVNGTEYYGVREVEDYEFYYMNGATKIYVRNLPANITKSNKTGFLANQSKITENTANVDDLSLRFSIGEYGTKLTDTTNDNVQVHIYHNTVEVQSATLDGDSVNGYSLVFNENNIEDMIGDWRILIGCYFSNGFGSGIVSANQGYNINDNLYYNDISFTLVRESDYYVSSARPKIKDAETIDYAINSQNYYNANYYFVNAETSDIPSVSMDTTKFRATITQTDLNGDHTTYQITRRSPSTLQIIKNGTPSVLFLADNGATEAQSKNFKFYFTDLGHYRVEYTPIIKINGNYEDLTATNLGNWTRINSFELTNMGYQSLYSQGSGSGRTLSNFYLYKDVLTLDDYYNRNYDTVSNVLTNKRTNQGNNTLSPEILISNITPNTPAFDDIKAFNASDAANVNSLNTYTENAISTNQPPISFRFSGKLATTETAGVKTIDSYYWFKNATTGVWELVSIKKASDFFVDAGTYLVCLKYVPTSDAVASIQPNLYQYFSFVITNSQAEYQLENASGDVILNNDLANQNIGPCFTNEDVNFVLASGSEFDVKPEISIRFSDLSYSQTRLVFNGSNLSASDLTVNTVNQNYTFKSSRHWEIQLYFGPSIWTDRSSYVNWTFTIDKNPIAYNPISKNGVLDDSVEVLGANDRISLTYGNVVGNFALKQSGARITTTYTYTPLEKLETPVANANKRITSEGLDYIKTNYQLNFDRKTGEITYVHGKEFFANSEPGLYEFSFIDLAGNTSSYYIYLDNTAPEFYIEDNTSNANAPRYSAVWGDFKTTLVFGTFEAPTKVRKNGTSSFTSSNPVISLSSQNYLVSAIGGKQLDFYADGSSAVSISNQTENLTNTFSDEEAIQVDYKNYLVLDDNSFTVLKTKRNEGRFIVYAFDSFGNKSLANEITFSFDLSKTTLFVKDANSNKGSYKDNAYPNLVNQNSSNLDYLFVTSITQGQTEYGNWTMSQIKVDFYELNYTQDVYSTNATTFFIYNRSTSIDLLSTLSDNEIIKIVNENLDGETANGKYVITRTYNNGFAAPPDMFEAITQNGKAVLTSGIYYYDDVNETLFTKNFVEISDANEKAALLNYLQDTGSTYTTTSAPAGTYVVMEKLHYYDLDSEKYYYVDNLGNISSDGDVGYQSTATKRGIDTDEAVKIWTVYKDNIKPIDTTKTFTNGDVENYVGENNKLKLQPEGENLAFNRFILNGEVVSIDTNLLPIVTNFLTNKYSSTYSFFDLSFMVSNYNENNESYYAGTTYTLAQVGGIYTLVDGNGDQIEWSNGQYKIQILDNVSSTIFNNEGAAIAPNSVEFCFKATARKPIAEFVKDSQTILLDDETSFVSVKSISANEVTFEIEDPEDYYQAKVNPSAIYQITNLNNNKTLITPTTTNHLNNTWGDLGTRKIHTITLPATANGVYSFEIQFVGEGTNYVVDEVSFFKEIYTIVIDNVLPQTNIQSLLDDDTYLDEAGISTATTSERTLKDYQFNINDNKTFNLATTSNFDTTLEAIYGNGNFADKTAKLDTYKIFFRQVNTNSTSSDILSLPSLLPGDTNYNNNSFSNPRFAGVAGGYYYEFDYNTQTFKQALEENGISNSVEVFEIIEVDAAGNYQSYYVYYTPFASAMTVIFDYENYFNNLDSASTTLFNHESVINNNDQPWEINAVVNSNVGTGATITITSGLNLNSISTANNWFKMELQDNSGTTISTLFHTSSTTIESVRTWILNNVKWNATSGNTYFLVIKDRFDLETPITIQINLASTSLTEVEHTIANQIEVEVFNTQSQYISNIDVSYYTTYNLNSVDKTNDDNSLPTPFSSNRFITTTYYLNKRVSNYDAIYYFYLTDNFGRQQIKTYSVISSGNYFYESNDGNFYFSPADNDLTETTNETGDLDAGVTGRQIAFEFNLLYYYDVNASSIDSGDITYSTAISSSQMETILFDYKPFVDQTIILTLVSKTGNVEVYTIRQYTILPQIYFTNGYSEAITPSQTDANGFSYDVGKTNTINATYSDGLISVSGIENLTYTVNLIYTNPNGNEFRTNNIFNVTLKTFNDVGNYRLIVLNSLGTQVVYEFAIDKEDSVFYSVKSSSGANLNSSFIKDSTYNCFQYYSKDVNFKIYVNTNKQIRFLDNEENVIEQNDAPIIIATASNASSFVAGSYYIFHLKSDENSSISYEEYVKVNIVTSAPALGLKKDNVDVGANISEASTSSVNGLTLNYLTNLANETNGNYITAYVYYKEFSQNNLTSVVVPTMTSATAFETTHNLLFKEPGQYFIQFVDLAGNIVAFGQESVFTVYNLSQVLGTAISNNNTNSLVNDLVVANSATITIDNFNKYNTFSYAITKDGNQIATGTNSTFTIEGVGTYEITFNAKVGASQVQQTKYRLIIVNPSSAKLGFEYFVASNYSITKVYQGAWGSNDRNELAASNYTKNKLVLSHLQNGNGYYTVLVDVDFSSNFRANEQFSFNVLIANTIPVVESNRDLGKTTSKAIELTFNPKQIYSQQGNCKIVVVNRENNSVIHSFDVNASSADKELSKLNIKTAGTYDIQVWSESGESLFYWTSITYKTPLNAISIILIIIGSLVGLSAIVLFIFLRTKMKVR